MSNRDDAPETMRSIPSPVTPRKRPIRVTMGEPQHPKAPQTVTAHILALQGLPC